MRHALLIGCAILLSAPLSGGALAGDAPAGKEPKGWEKIIVPADSLSVDSVPSPRQLIYQTNQIGAFLHYGPAVFMNGDYLATPDPKVFNPTQLDAEQWVRVAKSFGAKHLVFSTKHHNGFCLWPTETTDYSVRSSPWKNGRGDVVREVADACKKQGIALGLYYSGHDRHFPCHTFDPAALANRERYWPVYRRQIEELLTNYGEITCLWLDHYGDPFSWPAKLAINPKTGKPYLDEIVALARAKQPNMVIWHGSQPDIHFCHNEEGRAPYPLWNVVHKGEGAAFDLPWAEGWIIPETYNCHGSFTWKNSFKGLMANYYTSVGRGANFLNALVPDERGLIAEDQVKIQAEFGAELRRRFGHPLAQTDSAKGWLEPGVLEIDLGAPRRIAHVVLEEEIAKGQHVLKYAVEASADGTWKTVAEGQSIGRKRIERFQPPIIARRIRLRVTRANAIPSIRAMLVYGEPDESWVPPMGVKSPSLRNPQNR